jgi:hypothetical protein
MPNINIFGVKFAYPRGLRKSPGTNWFASCVGRQLSGKGGNPKANFHAAVQACKSNRNA